MKTLSMTRIHGLENFMGKTVTRIAGKMDSIMAISCIIQFCKHVMFLYF